MSASLTFQKRRAASVSRAALAGSSVRQSNEYRPVMLVTRATQPATLPFVPPSPGCGKGTADRDGERSHFVSPLMAKPLATNPAWSAMTYPRPRRSSGELEREVEVHQLGALETDDPRYGRAAHWRSPKSRPPRACE